MVKVPERPIIDIPTQGEDRPVWAKAGVIAIIGFALGIAWPRLAGVRLGPTPPEENKPAAAVPASASPARSGPSAMASVGAAPVASGAGAGAASTATTVAVSAGKVLTCRNAKGKALEECDTPDFDQLLGPKLKGLAKCGAISGLAGKLSVGLDVEFTRNRWKLVRGKSTTLPEKAAQPVWQCLENDLQKLTLDEVTHQQARYSVFYTVQIVPPGKAADIEVMPEPDKGGDKKTAKGAEPDDGKTKDAGLGSGSVVYDAALVRDEPKEGKVIARLVRGTKVELLSKKGGWYKIRFGEREGWVYSGSIAQ